MSQAKPRRGARAPTASVGLRQADHGTGLDRRVARSRNALLARARKFTAAQYQAVQKIAGPRSDLALTAATASFSRLSGERCDCRHVSNSPYVRNRLLLTPE
jgi:hypothetical protein